MWNQTPDAEPLARMGLRRQANGEQRSGGERWPGLAVLGTTGGLALASSLLVLHGLGHVVARVLALAAASQPVTPGAVLSALTILDPLLAAVSLILLAALIRLEWVGRCVSRLVAAGTPKETACLLVILLLWFGHSYLFPGLLLGGDTDSHVSRFLEVRRGLEAGFIPQWTNYQYLGSPLLAFTGPFTYVVGGALDLLLHDPVASTKTLLFTTHVATGVLFYALLLRMGFSRPAALLAAVGWSCSFAQLQLFLHRGLMPQMFTIIFLVLLWHAAEGLMRRARTHAGDWLLFALATGGMMVNHQPHGPFAALYLALFGGISLLQGRWRWRGLPALITAGVAGVAISAVAVLPILAGSDWVMMDPESAFFRFQAPTLHRLAELLAWHDTRTSFGQDYWGYLGLVTIGLAACGTWAVLARRAGTTERQVGLAALPCLALCFFLVNPVVRDIMFLGFFLAMIAAVGVEAVRRRGGQGVVCAVAVLLFLDVFSTSIQPFARTDKGFQVAAGQYLERVAADQRVVEIGLTRTGPLRANTGPEGTPLSFYSTVQRVSGNHNMAATLVHNYAVTIVNLGQRDLRATGRLSADSATLYGLLNVSRIVCLGPFSNGCPASLQDLADDGPLRAIVRVPQASPVLFSQQLTLLAPPPGMDKPALWDPILDAEPMAPRVAEIADFLKAYLRAAGPIADRHAAALPVRSIPPSAVTPVAEGAWHPELQDYAVSLSDVRLTIVSDRPGYVQLSHPYYPGNEIRINGTVVAPLQGAFDLIVLPVQAGRTVIALHPRTSRSTQVGAAISGTALAGSLAVVLWLAVRRRPGRALP